MPVRLMPADPTDLSPGRSAVRSWVWSQKWQDVLFLHWRVPVATLRPLVPPDLEVDAYRAETWVSLVLFRLQVRLHGFPYVPFVSSLVEANLRTYVRLPGRPGIWFLSVHADNPLAIRFARFLTPLRYTWARMHYRPSEPGGRISAQMTLPGGSQLSGQFQVSSAEEHRSQARTPWLLERYHLFVESGARGLQEAEVVHPPWMTRRVEVTFIENTLGSGFGLDLNRLPDAAHFSSGVSAKFGRFRSVGTQGGTL